MSVPREILIRTQDDSYFRLLAAAYLQDVATIKERPGMTADEIKKLLGTLVSRSGKVGVCILVQRPIIVPESDNAAARSQIIQAFTVLEHPTINSGSQGTGKTAQEIAVEVFRLFHGAAASLPGQVFSGYPGGAIVPDDGFPGLNGWEVRLQSYAGLVGDPLTGTPLIDPDSGAGPQLVTITCGDAGASIYYTLDGSAPTSGNPAATLYTVPFNVPAGSTVRSGAEVAGKRPSNVAEALFDTEFSNEFSNEFA